MPTVEQKTSKANHFQDIADFLAIFEEKESEWILEKEYLGFNAWQLLRKPLYYNLKNNNYGITKEKNNKRTKLKTHIEVRKVFSYLISIIKAILFKQKADLIFANSTYKLEQNENGKYVDIFLDSIITSQSSKKYIYFETPKEGLLRKPSLYKHHINNDGLRLFINLLHKRFSKDADLIELADIIEAKLKAFAELNQYSIPIKATQLKLLLARFKAQYVWHKLIFKLLNSKRLFIVDGMPGGVMAAAIKNGMTVYEFQHGLISKDKHDYMLSSYFNKVRNKLVIPYKVCVFGDFFKNQLIGNGFWKEKDVISVGNYRIEKQRNYIKSIPSENISSRKVRILFATQLTTFEQTKVLLTNFIATKPQNVIITIKCHPREPIGNLDFYKNLCSQHKDLFNYISSNDSLVQALIDNDILMSFHSTALFEAMALGFPVITISTEQYPNGVNDLLNADLSEVIKPINNAQDLNDLVHNYHTDFSFSKQWKDLCVGMGEYLYKANYIENLQSL